MTDDELRLYDKKLDELQKVWEDNEGLLHERHGTFAGIRSSQIAALLLYLIKLKVIAGE